MRTRNNFLAGEGTLFKNVGWLLALQAVNIVLPFVTVPYVTRVFGAESYGVFLSPLTGLPTFSWLLNTASISAQQKR